MGLELSSRVALPQTSLLHPHVTVGYVQLDYKHGCVQVCSTNFIRENIELPHLLNRVYW